MENTQKIYLTKIDDLNISLKRNKSQRSIYLIFKLSTFIGFVITLYYSFSGLTFIVPILSLATYILILYLDTKQEIRQKEIKELIRNYSIELAYLNGDLSELDNGCRFISPEHEYSIDLDIFGENSLFQEINRTVTPNGANILAEKLNRPSLESTTIRGRQEAVNELSEHIEWTHDFRIKGRIYPVADYDDDDIEKWKKVNYFLNAKIKPLLYTLNGIAAISLLSSILGFTSYSIFVIVTLLQLLIFAFLMGSITKIQGQLDKVIKSIKNFFYLINHISNIDFRSTELQRLKTILFGESNSLRAFKSLRGIQNNFDQRNNILVLVVLNSLYLSDIYMVLKLISWRNKYINNINAWLYAVSEFDALISMANYKYNHPEFIVPQITMESIITAKGIAHPLIKGEDIVKNDFEIKDTHEMYIVTGANMSGKSTFLRSVGLNMVLALSGNVVRSDKFMFTPIELFTSMRTTDNLSQGKSYFHAELLRLKALHQKAKNGQSVFVILDEMLKGTNSEDKLNGSLKFLVKLLQLNISGIVATHDLALGKLSDIYPNNFYNICFEIEHSSDEDIVYTYKLQDGVSKNMNASFLLEKMELI